MQFQVPQFIETEDKVVGPFSIRQFVYVGIAAVISAVFYFLVQTWLFIIIALILIGGALAISFLKVEGRPLFDVLIAGARFYWRPQTYIWKPEHHPSAPATAKRGSGVPLEDMAAQIVLRKKWEEKIETASPLRKTWEAVQTGAPFGKKISDRQLVERKMNDRYQIFQKVSGERKAAHRVDYR